MTAGMASAPVAPKAPPGRPTRLRPAAPNRKIYGRPPSPDALVVEGAAAEDTLPKVEIHPSELEYKESIGTGATAEVFRGIWGTREVAIKEIHRQRKGGQTELKQQIAFTREFSVLSRVHHPNLVCFFGASLEQEPLRLVTEFCSGGCLFELLHESDADLVWNQTIKMCVDIASGVHYLHSFTPQIIHRDLKSLNLLLVNKVVSDWDVPHVKVSDFGTARMKDLDHEWEKLTKQAGTYHWMAPEVLAGKYDERADVYSYSMVLFEIIGREIPFEDHEGVDVLALTCDGHRPDLDAVPPDCPSSLRSLMIRCWSHNPRDRPLFSEIVQVVGEIGSVSGKPGGGV